MKPENIVFPYHEVMFLLELALEKGQSAKINANGSSMLPFILSGDVVELVQVQKLRIGDIILAKKETSTPFPKYVLHRIVKIDTEGKFFIRGDAQTVVEGPFCRSNALGKVKYVWRKNNQKILDSGLWFFLGKIWIRINPLGVILMRPIVSFYRRFITRSSLKS